MAMQAIASYLALGGNEIVNAARTKAYADSGLIPTGFNIRCHGCAGLLDILPCGFSEIPEDAYDYTLPELDDAPWYDPNVPESKNFAGLLVTNVTISAPYARNVTPNTTRGSTLGRLRIPGRLITVRAQLIGKTCCATQYGLQWLTAALGGDCASGDCTGQDLDFISCCPNINTEDECLTTLDPVTGRRELYTRPPSATEFQRGRDFWRRMHNVGVVSGPDILGCKGRSCGCGCGALIEVEFVLAAGSPYMNTLEEPILPLTQLPTGQCNVNECGVTWNITDGPCGTGCGEFDDCREDPECPLPALPPAPGGSIALGCNGCIPLSSGRVAAAVTPVNDWGQSTVNFEVYAGDSDLRNVAIRIWQNPLGWDCGDVEKFPDCDACSTLIVGFVPAGGTLRFSGEERKVTIECNKNERNALRNVSGLGSGRFSWPELTCNDICVAVTFDCDNVAANATVKIDQVGQYL